MKEGLTIGQLAFSSGVSIDTVRVYERQGLIEKPERRSNGYRHYQKDAIKRIFFIRRAKAMGFSLREIKELLDISQTSTHLCKDTCDHLKLKLHIVEQKLNDLKYLKKSLKEAIQTCHTTIDDTCPILEALERE